MADLSDSIFGHINRKPKKEKRLKRKMVTLKPRVVPIMKDPKTGPVLYSSIGGKFASYQGKKSKNHYVPDSDLEETAFRFEPVVSKQELSKEGIFFHKNMDSEEKRKEYDKQLFGQDSSYQGNTSQQSSKKDYVGDSQGHGDETPFDDLCCRNWKL